MQYNPYIRSHNPPVCSEIIETGQAKEVWICLWHIACFHCGWALFAWCLMLYVWCSAGMWICMNAHHATEEPSSVGSLCCSTVPVQWVFYCNCLTTNICTNMHEYVLFYYRFSSHKCSWSPRPCQERGHCCVDMQFTSPGQGQHCPSARHRVGASGLWYPHPHALWSEQSSSASRLWW